MFHCTWKDSAAWNHSGNIGYTLLLDEMFHINKYIYEIPSCLWFPPAPPWGSPRWASGSDTGYFQITDLGPRMCGLLYVLCPMSKSPSGKRESLQNNATGKKGKFITDSSQGPLPHPTQWCRSESLEPKLLQKFIGWAYTIGLSGLVTSLQSNFIGQNFLRGRTFLGVSAPFLIS